MATSATTRWRRSASSCARVASRVASLRTGWPARKRASLRSWLPKQEQAAAFVDQAEHDAQRAGVVGAVVGEVAKLHHEAVGGGGVAERNGVAMHVAHHPDGRVLRDGSNGHVGDSLRRGQPERNVPSAKLNRRSSPEQEHAAAAREQPRDGRVAHIEPAGVGAERRHHQAPGIGHEAGAAHAAAACRHRRLGMVVAGDLALRAGRGLVAEDQRGGGECLHPLAADALRRRRDRGCPAPR